MGLPSSGAAHAIADQLDAVAIVTPVVENKQIGAAEVAQQARTPAIAARQREVFEQPGNPENIPSASPVGLRPANRLNQQYPDSGIPVAIQANVKKRQYIS
jgi:hypothetical protein